MVFWFQTSAPWVKTNSRLSSQASLENVTNLISNIYNLAELIWRILHAHCLPSKNQIILTDFYPNVVLGSLYWCQGFKPVTWKKWKGSALACNRKMLCDTRTGRDKACQTWRLQLHCLVCQPPSLTNHFTPCFSSHHFVSHLHYQLWWEQLIQQIFSLRIDVLPAQGALKPVHVLPKDLEHLVPLT